MNLLLNMTEEVTTEFTINKEQDLGFLYDLAKQRLENRDFETAENLAQVGIREAKNSEDKRMEKKLNLLHSEIIENKLKGQVRWSLDRGRKELDIFRYNEAIKFLHEAKEKLNDLFMLGKNEVKINKQIKDIDKLINEAKSKQNEEILPEKFAEIECLIDTPDDEIMPINIQPMEIEEIIEEVQDDKEIKAPPRKVGPPKRIQAKVTEINGDDIFYGNDIQEETEEIETVQIPQPQKNTNIEEGGISDDSYKDIIDDFLSDDDLLFNPSKSKRYRTAPKPKRKAKKRDVSHEKIENNTLHEMVKGAKKRLKESGFYVIPIKELSKDIDMIGIKIVRAKEMLDLIYIVPVKICNLKGTFIVSEDSIDYIADKGRKLHKKVKSSLTGATINPLLDTSSRLFLDIASEGQFLEFFKKYLKVDLTVEKAGDKSLFFWDKKLQYKIIINPVLLTQKAPRFLEKSNILFPHQRHSNLYVCNHLHLDELLSYLNEKYEFIEDCSDQKSEMDLFFEEKLKLSNDLKVYSLPFSIFGFIYLLLLSFQVTEVLYAVNGIAIGSLIFYFVLLAYFSWKFKLIKDSLAAKFATPYFKREINLEESDIYLLQEKMTVEMERQFMYECYGKEKDLPIIPSTKKLKENRKPKTKPKLREGSIFDTLGHFLEE